ncbi:multiheme c-type cytochrome [Melioribacteraceae bacterium 4301-Me]|uniref:multiheme c-type cytochrome n=1 Tax=Pyranulibacter aquaticus TaxID=3163344 RepID=UPI00359AE20F
MARRIFYLILTVLLITFPQLEFAQSKATYEGVQVCGMCHKSAKQGEQLKIWQESAHAKAYKTLQTKEADEIAQKLHKKKAVEDAECLSCHVTGAGKDKSMFGSKFKIEDGVQCEACHGPGSEYKSMKIMKDRAAAVKAGLVLWKDEKEIEKFCTTCHNEKSPTFKKFDFKTMWAKIKHPVPKG